MELTQKAVLSFLLEEGGKVVKSSLLAKFKDSLECVDPAGRERNRDLFRTFVNNVASVREIDGVRYVVVKNPHQHLLRGVQNKENLEEKKETEGIHQKGEQERTVTHDEKSEEGSVGAGEASLAEPSASKADEEEGEENENPSPLYSSVELALQRSRSKAVKVKRMLNFDILRDTDKKIRAELGPPESAIKSKPYALPLRTPPTRVEVQQLKVEPNEPPVGTNRMLPSRSTKASEDSKISTVPLENTEHKWMVKCAAGHWGQAYGLLLNDCQLAGKRDFISGFTALHWAAKFGNTEMLVKIIDVSKKGGVDINVNAKTREGYTALHIAALHDQERIIVILVGELGVDVNIRDNSGRKAHHYLHKGICKSVREMLGEPASKQPQDRVYPEKEDPDLLPDLSKGLHSIGRLFQPTAVAQKKKQKQRSGFYSLSDSTIEEKEESSFRQRSDTFV
ncbi:ankyrin repeat domain-containing protein SOWAHB [Oryzias melastigma]|nr:ankyrin repeat domain-containing protein SOWAHB [Oryzias melastigma]